MNLYRISQDVRNGRWYAFFGAVVAANTEDEAQLMHPDGERVWRNRKWFLEGSFKDTSWTNPKNVKVELLGTACNMDVPSVILSSWKGLPC